MTLVQTLPHTHLLWSSTSFEIQCQIQTCIIHIFCQMQCLGWFWQGCKIFYLGFLDLSLCHYMNCQKQVNNSSKFIKYCRVLFITQRHVHVTVPINYYTLLTKHFSHLTLHIFLYSINKTSSSWLWHIQSLVISFLGPRQPWNPSSHPSMHYQSLVSNSTTWVIPAEVWDVLPRHSWIGNNLGYLSQ